MYFIFDTETNGLPNKNPKFSIISIGWVVLDKDLKCIEKGYKLLNREDILSYEWDEGAENVHGISRDESISEGLDPKEVLQEVKEKIESCIIVFAHNLKFDKPALQETFRMFGFGEFNFKGICTMTAARLAYGSKKMSLKNCWSYLHPEWDFEDTFEHHNALDDARACGHIVVKMKRQNVINW